MGLVKKRCVNFTAKAKNSIKICGNFTGETTNSLNFKGGGPKIDANQYSIGEFSLEKFMQCVIDININIITCILGELSHFNQ